jgi:hypothetical protein
VKTEYNVSEWEVNTVLYCIEYSEYNEYNPNTYSSATEVRVTDMKPLLGFPLFVFGTGNLRAVAMADAARLKVSTGVLRYHTPQLVRHATGRSARLPTSPAPRKVPGTGS